jgi:hypothetical protein
LKGKPVLGGVLAAFCKEGYGSKRAVFAVDDDFLFHFTVLPALSYPVDIFQYLAKSTF